MSVTTTRRRRRRRADEAHDNDRWLLTYADMITLLLALFMVLFAISSVNASKFEGFRQSLQNAFNGRVMPGGPQLQQTGGSARPTLKANPEPPVPALKPFLGAPVEGEKNSRGAAQQEDEDFARLKRRIDAYAKERGLADKIRTTVARRGLVVQLLTDDILFASGSADLERPGYALLAAVGRVLKFDDRHPIFVEGHTDDVRIATDRFPTNWELSTGRASRVVRELIRSGIPRHRLGAAGYASLHPVATNGTETGRKRNRRVEIVLMRLNRRPTPR
jgi:chemotaxis protein MotB